MADKNFAAFFSYVHDDDTHDNGRISKLRQALEEEVQALSSKDFKIFQDYKDIHWGQKWEQRLNSAIDGSTFLIPVITPRYLKSEPCRKEVLKFLNREKELGRNDLVLSIYYIETDLSDKNDPVANAISSHQYFKWQDLRHEPFNNPKARKQIEKMAREIIQAIERIDSERAKQEKTASPILVVNQMPGRGDYTKITDAINAAEPGTRILVQNGHYKESLELDKPIELIGDGKREEILISYKGKDTIRFKTEFGRITNFTIKNLSDPEEGEEYVAVTISQGSPVLEDCDVSSTSNACVVIENGTEPRLRRNYIHDAPGFGILILGEGTIEDNNIEGNRSGGIVVFKANPTVLRNRIWHSLGTGIKIESSSGTFENNDIRYNNSGAWSIDETSKNSIRRSGNTEK